MSLSVVAQTAVSSPASRKNSVLWASPSSVRLSLPSGFVLPLFLPWCLLAWGVASAVEAAVCGSSTLGAPPTDVATALIFSGGGAKGAYEAGVAVAFLARGVPIRLVAGTSAGALNATLVAAGQVDVRRAVVIMSYAEAEGGSPPTTIRRAVAAFEMGMVTQIARDVELARLKYPRVEIHLLRPTAPLGLQPLDFDPSELARLLERGRADGLACLGELGD